MRTFIALTVVLAFVAVAEASLLGADNAGNYGAWVNGTNAGSGFGAWTLQASGANAGHFLGDSTGNAGGSLGIRSGNSWGMWANSGDQAEAFRQLTGGSLAVGQAFLIDMDNGWIDDTFSVGWGLQNSSGENLFEFGFTGGGGGGNYWLNDSVAGYNTGIGFTGDGLMFQLTLTGTATYDLQVIRSGTTNLLSSRSLAALGDQGILQLHMWNYSAGSGSDRNAFWDNMEVIPEPGTLTMLGLGAAALGIRILRRRM